MYSRVLPTDTPSAIFSEERGRLYPGYLERIIPSSKVRRIVHSKLKLFHFQIKTYYLSDANHLTDNTLDCKTVRIFAYSSKREQSNKRSGTRLKTESETGGRR